MHQKPLLSFSKAVEKVLDKIFLSFQKAHTGSFEKASHALVPVTNRTVLVFSLKLRFTCQFFPERKKKNGIDESALE